MDRWLASQVVALGGAYDLDLVSYVVSLFSDAGGDDDDDDDTTEMAIEMLMGHLPPSTPAASVAQLVDTCQRYVRDPALIPEVPLEEEKGHDEDEEEVGHSNNDDDDTGDATCVADDDLDDRDGDDDEVEDGSSDSEDDTDETGDRFDSPDMEFLLGMFPSLSLEALHDALVRSHGNVTACTDILLFNTNTNVPVAPTTAAGTQPACKYYLAGECLRADCMFAHDLSQVAPCSFFQAGLCLKGDACPFAHFYAAPISTAATPAVPPSVTAPSPSLTEDQFPSLPSTKGAAPFSAAAPSSPSPSYLRAASLSKISALQQAYPSVPIASLESILLRECGGVLQQAEKRIANLFPDAVRFCTRTASDRHAETERVRHELQEKRERERTREGRVGGTTGVQSAAQIAHLVAWVDTGASVHKSYTEIRAESKRTAEARNRCLQLARDCYLGSRGAAAREHSRAARELDTEMRALEACAAEQLFRQRNATSPANVLDLHGLHRREATHIIDLHLPLLVSRSLPNLLLICGTGHHSQGGHARLRPACRAHVAAQGFNVVETSRDGRGGLLLVTL